MACDLCEIARSDASYRIFTPACQWCGARYMQRLRVWPPRRHIEDGKGGHRETNKERQEWIDQVLKDWVAHGHDRTELLALAAAKELPLEPKVRKSGRKA